MARREVYALQTVLPRDLQQWAYMHGLKKWTCMHRLCTHLSVAANCTSRGNIATIGRVLHSCTAASVAPSGTAGSAVLPNSLHRALRAAISLPASCMVLPAPNAASTRLEVASSVAMPRSASHSAARYPAQQLTPRFTDHAAANVSPLCEVRRPWLDWCVKYDTQRTHRPGDAYLICPSQPHQV